MTYVYTRSRSTDLIRGEYRLDAATEAQSQLIAALTPGNEGSQVIGDKRPAVSTDTNQSTHDELKDGRNKLMAMMADYKNKDLAQGELYRFSLKFTSLKKATRAKRLVTAAPRRRHR